MKIVQIESDMIANGLIASGLAKEYVLGAPTGLAIRRVDDPLPRGTPDTVFLEQTGHVLSAPRVDAGEQMMGYLERTSRQTGLNVNAIGAYIMYQSVLHGVIGDPGTWPAMADEFACIIMGRPNPYAPAP